MMISTAVTATIGRAAPMSPELARDYQGRMAGVSVEKRETPDVPAKSGSVKTTGKNRMLVLLVEFADKTQSSQRPASFFKEFIFGESRGLRHYLSENSYYNFSIDGDVFGWFKIDENISTYAKDTSNSYDDANGPILDMVIKVLEIASSNVAFSDYDGDADGVLDHLIIIHPGEPQESSPGAGDEKIWSHAGEFSDTMIKGVKINRYVLISQYSPLGIYAHEFYHDLGMPDLYDTNTMKSRVGYWDVMDLGGYLNNKGFSKDVSAQYNSPAHIGCWGKAKLGWLNPNAITSGDRIERIAQVENDGYHVYKISAGDSEYFMVENRQKYGYDNYLPGEGLLIWHIDDSRSSNSDNSRPWIKIVEADGRNDLWTSASTGDTRDPFYESNNANFTTEMSKRFNGDYTGIHIDDISEPGYVMYANRRVENNEFVSTAGYPNPAKGEATFKFELKKSVDISKIKLLILDVSGEVVHNGVLQNFDDRSAPVYKYRWDCRNERGEPVADGAYICVVTARIGNEKVSKAQKITVLK